MFYFTGDACAFDYYVLLNLLTYLLTYNRQARVSAEAKEQGDKIKNTVDRHLGKLLDELVDVAAAEREEAISRQMALELAVSEMHDFRRSSEQLRTTASPCDVICGADDLAARARQLLDTYVIPADQNAPAVTFVPMNIDELTRGGRNLVGGIRRLSSPGQSCIISNTHTHTHTPV